ncbi:DNA primase [Aestuariibius insulae]|uniref:DNA primase n=1 Tax=Aestuariibius insulae TaxID=2058287 RepID=UPI00345E5EBE
MSLPPGFLDELRNRLSLGQVVGRKVAWDQRKSNQGKGDLWAPCPFHQEKTASFHVDDRKGFYYCFGCHAKGDAISFVRETENVGFMEAVKILAGEAGMEVPQASPQEQARADRRTELTGVMEEAARWFRLQLKTGGAAEARAYLEGRGFDAAKLERWEIGFAPEQGGAFAALTGKGMAAQDVIDAGIAAESDRGGDPYDRFRDRIIFPIRDARGRAIAFGGRAMAKDARAKYLNSPETLLFDKGRQLYNHGRAREAAGKGQPLVVAEGYMDVIALSEAGFTGAVAPLGTAITEDQLRLLWRIAPEPIIALDGDTAGLRAAMRLIDIALPLLEAGQSLRFALMPEGQDPDDVLREKGTETMQTLLESEKTVPMVRMLWDRELKQAPTDTPEARAGLMRRLRSKISLINDRDVKFYYGQAIKQFRDHEFRPQNWAPGGAWSKKRSGAASAAAKLSFLAQTPSELQIELLRETVILAVLLKFPGLTETFEPTLEEMQFADEDYQKVLSVLIELYLSHSDEQILENIGQMGLSHVSSRIRSDPYVRVLPALKKDLESDIPQMTVAEQLALLEVNRGHRLEMRQAEDDIADFSDEKVTRRVARSAEAMRNAGVRDDDKTEYQTGPNGARIKKDEKSAFEALLKQIGPQNDP